MPKGNLLFGCNITLDRQSQSKPKVPDNRKTFLFSVHEMFSNQPYGTKSTGTKRCFAKGALPNDLIDFASNDYLGFLSQKLFLRTHGVFN
jgi:hypothetical protein